MMIIGLVGFAGAGKNTVGQVLSNKFDFQQIAFANSVKDATAIIFGWDRELLEGDTEQSRVFRETEDEWWSERLPTRRPVTPRKMMQLMGTEAGRVVFGSDIWIHSTFREMERYSALVPDWVVTDVRFPNEINAIRKAGGIIIRVKRGDEPEWIDLAREANQLDRPFLASEKYHDVHYSEWAWIGQPTDHVIENDGSVDDLCAKVKNVLNQIESSVRIPSVC